MIQLIFISYVFIVIALSLIPTPVSGTGMYSDKIAHLLAYMLMSVLAFLSVSTINKRIYLFILIICIGLTLEVLQNFIPGRQFAVLDILANFIGLLLGYVLGWIAYSLIFKNLNSSGVLFRSE